MLYKATSKLKKRRPETLGIAYSTDEAFQQDKHLIRRLKHGETLTERDFESSTALLERLIEDSFIEAANEIKETDDASTI